MVKLEPIVTSQVDANSIEKMRARVRRRRELGYQTISVPPAYLEMLLEIAEKAIR